MNNLDNMFVATMTVQQLKQIMAEVLTPSTTNTTQTKNAPATQKGQKIHGLRQLAKYVGCGLKKGLYAATLSGLFILTSNISDLKQHSSFICIDIDGKENPNINDFNRLKTLTSGIDGLVCSALSSSGNGLFCVISIESSQQHINHFFALERDFLNMGIVIDPACNPPCPTKL